MRIFISIICLILILAGGLFFSISQYHGQGPLKQDKLILVPKGAGLNLIAAKLEKDGVIEMRYIFIIAARINKMEASLKAGEYLMPASISAASVLGRLGRGETFKRQFTIPEGFTSHAIIQRLKTHSDLTQNVQILPAEGSLLPETYDYQFGDTRPQHIALMQKAMTSTVNKAWENRAPGLPLKTKTEALILASIVEKETGISTERSKVAGVFINRLRIGMPLQSDPTVIYAVTNGGAPLGRPIYKRDLRADSPYNTYLYKGLPPTPICNPGSAAITATLNPDTHNFLYFVADGTGGHAFASTLADHNRNVARWRKIERSR